MIINKYDIISQLQFTNNKVQKMELKHYKVKNNSKSFANLFRNLQEVPSASKLQHFSRNQSYTSRTMKQKISKANQQQKLYQIESYREPVKTEELFGVDQKIKELQDNLNYKKQKILAGLKQKLRILFKKFGFSNQQVDIQNMNNQVVLLDFTIKKFFEKDEELQEIWLNKQKQLKELKATIENQQLKINQRIEQNQYLIQRVSHLQIILKQKLLSQLQNKEQLQLLKKNNQIWLTEIQLLKSQINKYKIRVAELQNQQKQEISHISKVPDLSKSQEDMKFYKQRSGKIFIDFKLQQQPNNKIQKQIFQKQDQQQPKWRQIYQSNRKELDHKKLNNLKKIQENINYIKKIEDSSRQNGKPKNVEDFLDLHIKMLEDQLKERGVPLQKLQSYSTE